MIKLSGFDILIEKGEDGYFIGSVPELPGCHTQAKSIKELNVRMKEAIELYLEEREKATKEVLSDPNLMRQIKESEKNIKEGRVEDLEEVIEEFKSKSN